jgi:hypothetical protein
MKKYILLTLLLCFVNSSCVNIYEEMSSKDTDDAILYEARKALGSGDWDGAIAEFALLSPATLAETEVVIDRASAYSGRCGLDFLGLAQIILNIDLNTTPIMKVLSDNYHVTTATNTADCVIAENLLKTVADANGVVSTERGQFLMAFNSLVKIGTILNFYSDTDDNDTPDPGWNACSGTGLVDLPDADAAEIATGIVLFYNNLQNSTFGTVLTGPIGTLCTAIQASIYDFCDQIDTAGITVDHRKLIRSMVTETDDKIGLQVKLGGTAANAPTCP